jgi:hypothetical protein
VNQGTLLFIEQPQRKDMTDPRPVCTEKTQDIIKTLRSNVQVEAALELAVKQQEKRIADQLEEPEAG